MKHDINYVALDLEFNQPSRKIIQVGIAIGNPSQEDSGYLVRKWDVRIDEPINPEITDLTGISTKDNEQGTTLAVVAAELSALLIATKAFVNPVTWGGGDSTALLEAFASTDLIFLHFGRRWIDVKTMTSFLAFSHHSGPRSMTGGLSSIMGRYKLAFKGKAHRADVDSFNTLRLFFAVIKRQQKLETAAAMFQGF